MLLLGNITQRTIVTTARHLHIRSANEAYMYACGKRTWIARTVEWESRPLTKTLYVYLRKQIAPCTYEYNGARAAAPP